MNLLKRLWGDEHGMVMSAEMVMLGTVGILAMTAGVGVMSTAVNDELTEMGQAFRSFNQNFEVVGFQSSYSGGVASGGGGSGGRMGMSSSKGGSGFTQRIDSEQAAHEVRMEYLPRRDRQRDMIDRAENASLSAQSSFQLGAEKAAELQRLQAELIQQQLITRQFEDELRSLRKSAGQADTTEPKEPSPRTRN